MFTKANIALGLGVLLAGMAPTAELAAQSADKAMEKTQEMAGSASKEGSGSKAMAGGTVYLDGTFENQEVGSEPSSPEVQRVKLASIVDGGGKVGSGKVLHYNDNDVEDGGALEYNAGKLPLGNMYIEFDALNNDTALGDKNSAVIFGVGPWEEGRSLALNSKSKRAFGFEMYQQKNLRLRVGDASVSKLKYDSSAPFNVKIWANDHDGNSLSYKRPDNGETAELGPNSVVVYVNNALMQNLQASGTPMNKEVTEGNAILGRFGMSSASTKVANFLFDNLRVEGPSGESKPAEPAATDSSSATEATPDSMPGAETMSYRDGEKSMNLFVHKPEGWKADDKRSAFVFFSAEVGPEVLR